MLNETFSVIFKHREHFYFVFSETDFPISKPRMKGGKTRWGTICRWTRISAREIKLNMAQDTSGSWRTSKRQTSRWWMQLHQFRKFQRYISTFFMIFRIVFFDFLKAKIWKTNISEIFFWNISDKKFKKLGPSKSKKNCIAYFATKLKL